MSLRQEAIAVVSRSLWPLIFFAISSSSQRRRRLSHFCHMAPNSFSSACFVPMNDVTSSAVSSFSRQINCTYLPADGVQAALLPQFRGTAFPSFGQEAQVIALVEIQPPEAADLPHIAERAVQPQASGPDPLDGDGPVPMITEDMGIPLAVFLNALPDGWDITALSQPVKPHRLLPVIRHRAAYHEAGAASSS